MLITRTSMASGITRTLDLPITKEQYEAWEAGMVVQRAFPQLSVDEREFIITGMWGDEWDALFSGEE